MDRLLFWRKFGLSASFIVVIALWGLLVVLTVMAPAQQAIARYGITITQGNILRATVLVPQLVAWLAAVFAVTRFKRYAFMLRGSAEHTAFKYLSISLTLLMLVLIVPSFINVYASYYPEVEMVQKVIVIVRTYFTILLYFGAFWFLFKGGVLLNKTIEFDPLPLRKLRTALIVIMAALTTLYVWAIFHNAYRTVTDNPLIRPTYFLPDWLIVLTVLIPYLIVWTIGGLAIVEIRLFARQVSGVVYRKAFNLVSYGAFTIISFAIGLQLLSQAALAFSYSSLKLILLIVYALLLLIAVGYGLLARGARALTAIEEV